MGKQVGVTLQQEGEISSIFREVLFSLGLSHDEARRIINAPDLLRADAKVMLENRAYRSTGADTASDGRLYFAGISKKLFMRP